jgi:hypothetical protein
LVSKVKVKKNHLNELNCEGEVVLAGAQLLPNDKKAVEEFKTKNRDVWISILEEAKQATSEEKEDA